jgi:signal transduction histidine kinase
VSPTIQQVLAVILGSLSLLKKVSRTIREFAIAGGAIQGAERGKRDQALLAFARARSCSSKPSEMQKLIPDLLDFLRQSVGPNISIEVDISPEVHPVKIDANQFELALMNLAVNARDAMPKGGVLTISCRDETAAGQNDVPKELLVATTCASAWPTPGLA